MLQLNGENYLMHCDNTDFNNRQKTIFDKLDAVKVANPERNIVLKAQAKKFMKTDLGKVCTDFGNESTDVGRKVDTKHFKGKESIFKRPDNPAPRQFRQKIPDYQKNPHKWKKYSLCDVSQDDMSEKSNTAAAMAFLNEMKSRKSLEDETMQVDEKIVFKRPSSLKFKVSGPRVTQVSNDASLGEDGTSYFRGSKLIMPEYVIGEKKKQVKDKKDSSFTSVNSKAAEIKLNHLSEYNDGEEEDEDFNSV